MAGVPRRRPAARSHCYLSALQLRHPPRVAGSGPMRPLALITQVLEITVALAVAPLFQGWINQCRAWLQNRTAPSALLPYYALTKLFHKDAVLADNASALFRIAPYVVFGTMVV